MEARVIREGVNDFLPEGLGSDISSPSSVSLTPDLSLTPDDSNSTAEDEQDENDEYNMSSDSDTDDDDNDDDDNDNDDNDNDDNDNDDSDKDPVTASTSAALLEESAESDANMTMSFLSVPEEMQPTTSKPKVKRKYTPREKGKSPTVSKKRRKKDKGNGEEGSNGGDEREEAGEGKKKKKNKPQHRRRNIKKFLTHGELTADTLTAQQEEEQRRKRLEEQKNAASLNAFAIPPELMEMFDQQPTLDDSQTPISTVTVDVSSASTATKPSPVSGGNDEDCIVLGSSSEGEDERKQSGQSGTHVHPQKKDVIEISSDEDAVTILSDDDDDDERAGTESRSGVEEASGMHTNDALNQPDIFGRVLVNVNRPQDEEEIFLPPQIVRAVKPHQIGGIRFLYDNLVETLKRFRVTSGFGCILAHSMGLGKTLQMISFINVFLRHTEAKTVLCIVPINTILNWVAEFDMWLPERKSNGVPATTERPIKKKNSGRKSKNVNVTEDQQMPDSVGTEESNSLFGDGDSCVGMDSPFEGLRTSEDLSCDGAPSSTTSPKESNEEESSGDVTYRQFPIFVMNDFYRTTAARHKIITKWYKTGGVLLMGYEMYRLLSSRGAMATSSTTRHTANKKKKKKQTASNKPEIIDVEEEDKNHQMGIGFHKALCVPGPDLVVCDEGHRIKNIHAGISQALKNIRTRRRVVLTGYPLQNNLQEYWCMVDFVRPNFLGTRHEFANLFERPIQNGQCVDSTYKDVQLMRFRAHVLYSLLEGFVQRRGFSVLHDTLPAKEETVLMVRLTPFQRGLYVKFMHCFTEMGAGGWCSANPLKAFSVGCKIWNHPDILCDVLHKRDAMADLDTDLDLPEPSSRCSKKGKKDGSKAGKKVAEKASTDKASTEAKKEEPEAAMGPNMEQSYQEKVNQIISFEWARDIMKNYQPSKLHNGGKMVLLFEILEASINIGDRLLVFSQSLSTLSLIEKFLADRPMPPLADPPADFDGKWARNKTYFRLDGSTPAADRERMINQFNAKDNKAVWLFLLSTRAGCLGINLIGANRVIVMDASWNPCHDAQAVCRVYRYGQKKKCHVYRMVTDNTLEKKIYDRQISKKGMSDRVVDELNPQMNLTKKEVETLLEFDADADDMPYEDFSNLSEKFTDPMLSNICNNFSNFLSKAPFVTESLLWDRKDRRLTRAEKRQAKRGYEEEKRLRVSYSRPSYTAFYPKNGNPPGQTGNYMKAPFGMPAQFYNPRPTVTIPPVQSTPVPRFHPSFNSGTNQRLADLQQAGVTMQRIVATTDIVLPGVNTQSSGPVIKAGQTVTFIKTQKGLYLRTTDGRILAVRGPGGGLQGKGLQGLAPFGQFTSLGTSGGDGGGANTLGKPWANATTGVPVGNQGGISSMDACNLPSASTGPVCGSSNPSSAKLDIVDTNQMNMQELLDKNDITASLASSISNENFLPKLNFTSSTSGNSMNPTHHSGYPQSLQSLNSLALGENTQNTAGMQTMSPMASALPPRNLPLFGSSNPLQSSAGTHHIPTTASIISSSGRLNSVTPSNHRLLSQQSAFPNSSLNMSGGTVPLAAIGMLGGPHSGNLCAAPSSSATSVTASSAVLQPKSSFHTESHIPLTLNNLLDGNPINAASKSQAGNDNGAAAEQSAIGNLGSYDQIF